jgi:outer membrane biosynthesis protein TonB
VDAGPTAVPDPEPEVVPTPEGEPDPEPEPLREPTPLRPPPPDEPPPAAAAADPDEAELIEQVLEAERAREATAEDAPAAETSAEATSDADVAAEADLDASTGEAARAANGAAAEAADDGPPLIAITGNEHERREPSAGAGPDQALGARLVALQMAVAGGNRGEVEAHLRRAFELADPAAILDDIFGSGTDSQKRVVWPEAG